MKVHPDFADFVSALNKHEVAYVIVGAYALAYHGHPRATGDIDFWNQRHKVNWGTKPCGTWVEKLLLRTSVVPAGTRILLILNCWVKNSMNNFRSGREVKS